MTLTPTEGFVTVSYATDINDPLAYRGWNISYSFCGESLGYASCDPLSDVIIAASKSDGVALEIVFGSLGAIAVLILIFFVYTCRKQSELSVEVTKRNSIINKLKEELTLLKAYGNEEQKLIGKEIMTFRENFARHREKNVAKKDPEERALEKFLIPASEVVPQKQIGRGR